MQRREEHKTLLRSLYGFTAITHETKRPQVFTLGRFFFGVASVLQPERGWFNRFGL
jgi:hypothetical protein